MPLSFYISGLSCAEYTTTDETAVNNVLGSTINGAISFTNHACTDEDGRRRQLSALSDTMVIETNAAVRDVAYGTGSSKDAITESVRQTLADSAASGALTAAIADEAASLDPSSSLRFAAVAATLAPSFSPSSSPTSFSSELPQIAEWWGNAAIGIIVVNLVFIIGFVIYMRFMLGSIDRLSNMNLLAIVLGWIDMVSDCLFGIEVRRVGRAARK